MTLEKDSLKILEGALEVLDRSFSELPEMSQEVDMTRLEAVIMECLCKEPGGRPSSASELAARLSECDVPVWTQREARSWWHLR